MLLSVIFALIGLCLTQGTLKILGGFGLQHSTMVLSEFALLGMTHVLFLTGFFLQYQYNHLLKLSSIEYQAFERYGFKASVSFLVLGFGFMHWLTQIQ